MRGGSVALLPNICRVVHSPKGRKFLLSSPARHRHGNGIRLSVAMRAWIPFPALRAAGNDTLDVCSRISHFVLTRHGRVKPDHDGAELPGKSKPRCHLRLEPGLP